MSEAMYGPECFNNYGKWQPWCQQQTTRATGQVIEPRDRAEEEEFYESEGLNIRQRRNHSVWKEQGMNGVFTPLTAGLKDSANRFIKWDTRAWTDFYISQFDGEVGDVCATLTKLWKIAEHGDSVTEDSGTVTAQDEGSILDSDYWWDYLSDLGDRFNNPPMQTPPTLNEKVYPLTETTQQSWDAEGQSRFDQGMDDWFSASTEPLPPMEPSTPEQVLYAEFLSLINQTGNSWWYMANMPLPHRVERTEAGVMAFYISQLRIARNVQSRSVA